MTKFYTDVFTRGNYIYVRGYDEKGRRFQDRELYDPYLFVPQNKLDGVAYRDIHGKPVQRMDFDSISDAKDFIKQYSEVSGTTVYGFDKWHYMHVYDNYPGEIIADTSRIKIASIDIECASDDGFPEPELAEKEVTAIALRVGNQRLAIGCGAYEPHEDNITYIRTATESDLLNRFINVMGELDVDVITGWNTEFFDIPYLVNRIRKLLSDEAVKRLSPWKRVREYNKKIGTKELQTYEIEGIACLDYLNVYKKFNFAPRESYRLDAIAEVELGRKKVDYSEYGNLHTLHKENYQKFIEYNIVDVDLVHELDNKLGFFNQVFTVAYAAKTNYVDTLGTLSIWDSIIHNYLLDKNIVIPNKKPHGGDFDTIPGGFVKDPITGMSEWVVSLDLNSLYPHLILQYNIGPDTKGDHFDDYISVDRLLNKEVNLDTLKNNNQTMAANGVCYSKDKQSFLAELMQTFYDGRTVYKKKMIKAKQEYQKNPSKELEIEISRNHNMQMAMKILLNSAYGALANKYFRFFDNDNASAITLSGQLSIRWIEKRLNQYMNKLLETEGEDYVIAVDTDSVYLNFGPLVSRVFDPKTPKDKVVNFLDKVAQEKIEPVIDKSYQELADYMNAYDQKMVMKRENIGDKAIWTAKKRYIMNVWDSEGVRYEKPKLKMMGIEAIRSSTPGVVRNYIKKTLELVMTTDEETVQKYIAEIRNEFNELPFDQIAFPRGLSLVGNKTMPDGSQRPYPYADKDTIYVKGTPIQVKGALIYNHLLRKKGLDKQYEELKDGSKIKFCYLKKPNPVHDTVIAAENELPSELGLDNYLDKDMQFVKAYLDPLNIILHAIGWHHEKKMTLEGFFA